MHALVSVFNSKHAAHMLRAVLVEKSNIHISHEANNNIAAGKKTHTRVCTLSHSNHHATSTTPLLGEQVYYLLMIADSRVWWWWLLAVVLGVAQSAWHAVNAIILS